MLLNLTKNEPGVSLDQTRNAANLVARLGLQKVESSAREFRFMIEFKLTLHCYILNELQALSSVVCSIQEYQCSILLSAKIGSPQIITTNSWPICWLLYVANEFVDIITAIWKSWLQKIDDILPPKHRVPGYVLLCC